MEAQETLFLVGFTEPPSELALAFRYLAHTGPNSLVLIPTDDSTRQRRTTGLRIDSRLL